MPEFIVAGPSSHGFGPAQTILSLGVGKIAKVSLTNGHGLTLVATDASIVSFAEQQQLASNERTFEITGLKAGQTTVNGTDASGAVQASLQVVVRRTFREALQNYRVSDAAVAALDPESLATLKAHIQDLMDNPPPEGEFVNVERFSDNVLVRDGEKYPPNWGEKKGEKKE
jgi:hypothetical protein